MVLSSNCGIIKCRIEAEKCHVSKENCTNVNFERIDFNNELTYVFLQIGIKYFEHFNIHDFEYETKERIKF